MATVLESVGDYLVSNSLGTLATNLFLARMPDSPDFCTTIYEYEGNEPLSTFRLSTTSIDKPRIQIVTRGPRDDYPQARDRAVAIRTLLSGVYDMTISGVRILYITPAAQVFSLGPDEKDRPRVAVNYECHVAV